MDVIKGRYEHISVEELKTKNGYIHWPIQGFFALESIENNTKEILTAK